MHSLAHIALAQVQLQWDRPLSGPPSTRTRQLRGALANTFPNEDLFHQHDPVTGRVLYRYPHLQYRWHHGHGLIIGWSSAAQRLLGLPWLDYTLTLGDDQVTITDAALTLRQTQFAVSDRLLHYQTSSPILLFNQENYRHYQTLDAPAQALEQDRLLVAALLSAFRGLDINCTQRLYASFTHTQTRPSTYKSERLLGIQGRIVTNLLIPDGFAFGRAVSHGFGVVHSYQPKNTEHHKKDAQI